MIFSALAIKIKQYFPRCPSDDKSVSGIIQRVLYTVI
jgi:hypothetical protein